MRRFDPSFLVVVRAGENKAEYLDACASSIYSYYYPSLLEPERRHTIGMSRCFHWCTFRLETRKNERKKKKQRNQKKKHAPRGRNSLKKKINRNLPQVSDEAYARPGSFERRLGRRSFSLSPPTPFKILSTSLRTEPRSTCESADWSLSGSCLPYSIEPVI